MNNINPDLISIVNLLNEGDLLSSQVMSQTLNIAHPKVLKVIKQLRDYGITLEAIRGKGYQLNNPCVLLNYQKIKSSLIHKIKLDVFETLVSTNDYLKQFTSKNKEIRVCLSETQIKGKGRFERKWDSPFGENLYFSMLYPYEQNINDLAGLSLVIALAICRAIESTIPLDKACLSVKWPNDVMVNQQKLAGTLIEIKKNAKGYQIIIGIGINVNMTSSWFSLLQLTHQYLDRNILAIALINVLIEYLARFSNKGLIDFLQEWEKRDALVNQPIAILCGKKEYHGIYVGINEHGNLLLKTLDGTVQAFPSGDTTLLK